MRARPIPTPVRTEPVEGPSLFFGEAPEEEVQCFDKLSTNGCGEVREFAAKQNADAESFLASEQLKGENTPEECAEN